MNIKVVSRNVGFALLVSALFMFISVGISVAYGFDGGFQPLLISGLITLVFGFFPFIFVRQAQEISVKDGYCIIVLSWVLSFVFGMLPYLLWGHEFSVINAWFESVSGYTTTGATILEDIEAVPRSLLFWRSSTHFIGGLGVVVFLLLILPSTSPFRLRLTKIEVSSLTRQGYRLRSAKMVQVILFVYLGITVLAGLCYFLAGMDWFDAINHAFSSVSTGGFSTWNDSLTHFNSTAINVIAVVFAMLASLHFGLLYATLISRSLKTLFSNSVVRYFLLTTAISIVVIALSLRFQGDYTSFGHAVVDSVYQVVCFITTTGFGMVDNAGWPALACVVLMLISLQCGMSGSTSGGIKADRFFVAFKTMAHQMRLTLHPASVTQIKTGNNRYIKETDVLPVTMFMFIYIVIIFVTIALLLLCGVGATEAISGAVASISNVGPGLGELGTMCNYATQPVFAKLIYSICMFFGRIEIYPIFAVFYMMFNRDK
ncbi:MAG: TrkH family potassium uptake protein [Bacteroidales bacterium]|nr:TrkH family potassium uptake protein [Bacteroidales bacterium]